MDSYEDWGFATLPAPDQMAVDAAMLDHTAREEQGCIRFYDFPGDAVVYGYAQAASTGEDVPVARRLTGGSHIQVGSNTLAYSFAVPRTGRFDGVDDLRAYYADVVADGLRDLGVPDVTVDNDASTVHAGDGIIASHAIKWGVDSALFHGLLMVEPYDVDSIEQRLPLRERTIGRDRYSEYNALQHLPTLTTALDAADPERLKQEAANAIRDALEERDTPIRSHEPMASPEYGDPLPLREGEVGGTRDYCLFVEVPDTDFKRMAQPAER